jgi:pyridoxamine 5'-phosphate oxidase
MKIHELRRSYSVDTLKRSDLCDSPFQQLENWFADLQAAELPAWFEKNVMTLSTTDGSRVSSRIVLLKHFDATCFCFFTNYRSEKSLQIEANPQVSLNFHWPHVERQVRIEGIASKTDRATSIEYFDSRPRDSRVGAIVSSQSSIIGEDVDLEANRDDLIAAIDRAEVELTCPEWWGGWKVIPHRFEFWQGRPSRLHDRYRYVQVEGHWKIDRLSP